jgi:hypothetical protein
MPRLWVRAIEGVALLDVLKSLGSGVLPILRAEGIEPI